MWFEWLLAAETRLWIFLAACIIGVFLAALASLVGLFWEMALSEVVALVTAAQYGFFIATLLFLIVFIAAFEWSGRNVRVHPRYLEGPSRPAR